MKPALDRHLFYERGAMCAREQQNASQKNALLSGDLYFTDQKPPPTFSSILKYDIMQRALCLINNNIC
jgi:hypothetical protein